jgi:hypothetical protein
MVDGELDLEARIARIGRFGKALGDVRQRPSACWVMRLIATDVGDLLVVTQTLAE